MVPVGRYQPIEKLDGGTNSHHQDTKASGKPGKVSRFLFALLGVLVPWWLV
jgi:hypothetical protein